MGPMENHAKIRAEPLVHMYTEELERKQPECQDLKLTQDTAAAGKDAQVCSQELEFWLEQLKLEKTLSSPELWSLGDHANKLFNAWQVFHQRLPASERIMLNNRNPNWDDIRNVIERVQASWAVRKEGAYGTATARLRKILDSIHSHRTFLSILPESNNYASVFCGSVQVLIQASATYREVAEGLSQAILEINDIVRACSKDFHLFAGNEQTEMAASLYSRIFEFLEKAMSWYTKSRAKRLASSFKEGAFEDFKSDIMEIRELSHSIMRRSQQSMHIEGRTTNLMVQETRRDAREIRQDARETRQDVRETRQDIREMKEQTLLFFQQILMQKTRPDGKAFSLDHANAYCTEMLRGYAQEREDPNDSSLEIIMPYALQDSKDEQKIMTKSSLAHSVRSLGIHWERCERLVLPEMIGKTFVEAALYTALRDWRLDTSSHFLCVSRPWQTDASSPVHMLATAICSFAIQTGVPIIHASCKSSVEEDLENLEPESEAPCHLLYSLIAQLINILPKDFQSTKKNPIIDLDGTTKTFAPALHALKVLLDAAPSPLLCIIENLQSLEDSASDNEYLIQLLAALRTHSERCITASPARSFKVLFTISGRSTALIESLEPHEMVMADHTLSAGSASRRRSRPSQSPMLPITRAFFESLGMEHDEND